MAKNKIDLNSVKDLTKIKEAFVKTIDNRINEAERKQSVSSIGDMPFSSLNKLFESVTPLLYETNSGKSIIKKYIKAIRENDDLRKYYKIFESVNNPKNINDAQLFLQEAVALGKKIDAKKYKDSLKVISEIIKECIDECDVSTDSINNFNDEYKNSINESLDYLIFNKKTFDNINEYTNNMSDIISYINENKKDGKQVNESEKNARELVDILDTIFKDDMELWESNAVKDITFNELRNGDKRELYESYKADCINLIEESMDESNIEKYSRLNEMREKLSAKEYNSDTFIEDILKLSELKETLK